LTVQHGRLTISRRPTYNKTLHTYDLQSTDLQSKTPDLENKHSRLTVKHSRLTISSSLFAWLGHFSFFGRGWPFFRVGPEPFRFSLAFLAVRWWLPFGRFRTASQISRGSPFFQFLKEPRVQTAI